MINPVGSAGWLILEVVGSTQDVALQQLMAGPEISVVLGKDQLMGRGRFTRPWVSNPSDSLTFSMIFRDYPNHPAPHLVGMACAVALAETLGAQVQWPNDVVANGRKLAGVLTELGTDLAGQRIPIVGMGVNLNQLEFPPEIAHRATSLLLTFGKPFEAIQTAQAVVKQITTLPSPMAWQDISPRWEALDQTPGKAYRLNSGVEGTAVSVTGNGALQVRLADGSTETVLAADAIFGDTSTEVSPALNP